MTETWHAIPGGADERMRVGRIGHLIVAWRTKSRCTRPNSAAASCACSSS